MLVADALVARRSPRLLRLEQVHLHARVEVDAPSPLVSTAQKIVPGYLLGDERLHAVGDARARHAAEGLHAERHVRLALDDVHDQLADLHVAFAAAEIVVVVARARPRRSCPCRAGGSRRGPPACANVWKTTRERRRRPPRSVASALGDAARRRAPPRPYLRVVDAAQILRARCVSLRHLPDAVEEPRGDELDVGLGALALEEALELVVAVALGRHRPELADDADLRLRAACGRP